MKVGYIPTCSIPIPLPIGTPVFDWDGGVIDRLSELSTPEEWRMRGLSSGRGGEFFMVGIVIGLSCSIFLERASRRSVFISRSCGSLMLDSEVRYPSIFFSKPCEQVVNI